MIEIKPTIAYRFRFPTGKVRDVTVERITTTGTYMLASCICMSTGVRFYHTLPTGHAARYPVAFSEDGQQVFCAQEAKPWLVQPLLDSMFRLEKARGIVQKEVYKTYRSVIILNCLDDCYGHMIYKLFNAQRHLQNHSEHGLIVIIHRSLLWLVPQGVAEVWRVDSPIKQLGRWLTGLDDFVTEEIKRFDKVYLSAAVMYLDLSKINVAAFTKVSPFPLATFNANSHRITFVCREDRFWLPSRIDSLLYLLANKYKSSQIVRSYLAKKQNRTMQKTASLIRKHHPKSRFFAVGIGRTGTLGKEIIDKRVEGEVSPDTEKQWATLFASSHLVIGVHGSGLLIPTALAASFINLIPTYKIRHLGEDIVPRHSPSNMPFLGRFLDASSSATLVAHHAVEMLSGFFNHCFKTDPLRVGNEATVDNYCVSATTQQDAR